MVFSLLLLLCVLTSGDVLLDAVLVFVYMCIIVCTCLSLCVSVWGSVINPRHACAARVTVVGSVCLSVCLCVY